MVSLPNIHTVKILKTEGRKRMKCRVCQESTGIYSTVCAAVSPDKQFAVL